MNSKSGQKLSGQRFDEMSLSAKLGYLEQELNSSDPESEPNEDSQQHSDWKNNQQCQPESLNSSLIRESIKQNEKKRELFNQALARTTQRSHKANQVHSNASLPKSNDSSVALFQRSPLDFLKENCIKILNKKILKYKAKFSDMRSLIETLKQNKPDSYKKRYKRLRKDFASFLAAQRHKPSPVNQTNSSLADQSEAKISELSGKVDMIMQMLSKSPGKLKPTVASCYSYCYLKRDRRYANELCLPEVHSIENIESQGDRQFSEESCDQMPKEDFAQSKYSANNRELEELSDIQSIALIESPTYEIVPREHGIPLEQTLKVFRSVLETGIDHRKMSYTDFKHAIELFEQAITNYLSASSNAPIDLCKLIFKDDSVKLEKFSLLKDYSDFQITENSQTCLFVLKSICLLTIINFHADIGFDLELTIRLLESRQQSDYFDFQFKTLKTIIFGAPFGGQVTHQLLEKAISVSQNNFKLIPFVFNSVFHFMESQLVPRDNSTIFDRRSIKSSSKTSNFKGACSYVIRMKQLERVKIEMFTDPNDIWIAFKILFELQATSKMNHKFGSALRIIFENVKFRNTAQELIAMFAGSELVVLD